MRFFILFLALSLLTACARPSDDTDWAGLTKELHRQHF